MLVPKELVAWWVKHHSLRLHVLFNRKNNNNNNLFKLYLLAPLSASLLPCRRDIIIVNGRSSDITTRNSNYSSSSITPSSPSTSSFPSSPSKTRFSKPKSSP